MSADRQTSRQASEAVTMRWARHWEAMRRLVWEPDDVFERLWQIGEINRKLVTSVNDGDLLPGESNTGDWLRLLSVDELILVHAFADLFLYSMVTTKVLDHPKIKEFVVLVYTLVHLEKGPLYRSKLSIEAMRPLCLRLLCATQLELLARKGYLQMDDAVHLTGAHEGSGMSLNIRFAAGNDLVRI